jgi:hypothetical protein
MALYISLYCFLTVLGFELTVLHFQGRCFTLQLCLQPFILGYFGDILTFSLDWTGPQFYFILPAIDGMTGTG